MYLTTEFYISYIIYNILLSHSLKTDTLLKRKVKVNSALDTIYLEKSFKSLHFNLTDQKLFKNLKYMYQK